jgi:hypothetical protein
MLVCGLLVPAHLLAVDVSVIQDAGRQTPGLVGQGLELAGENNLGAAQLLWEAARMERLPDRQQLGSAVTNLAAQRPGWMVLGSPNPRLEKLAARPAESSRGATPQTGAAAYSASSASEPFTEFLVPTEIRDRALGLLETSMNPALQELLRCRDLTNTVIFPPSCSSSGRVFDTALLVCGLLLEERKLSPVLSNTVYELAWAANHGGHTLPGASTGPSGPSWNSEPLEQVLLDLMSLGQRFNWGQLDVFTGSIEDAGALRRVAYLVRKAEGQAPVLFAASVLSGQPGAVAGYVLKFSETGLEDVGSALQFGAGGVKELLSRNQRRYSPAFRRQLAAHAPFGALLGAASDYCLLIPWFALGMKWFLYLGSGFLLASAMHFGRPAVSPLERPLQVRGVHIAREILFALGFLLVVLILSEPFLSQESQKVELPFRVRLPLAGRALPAAVSNIKPSFMNQQVNLMTLGLFFVLQALVYIACLVKLAEIRRQQVPARLKIRLLENEDHLFDAGLYLGFVGTIVSFMLVTMGVVKFSIMAAYSSTSFGIIFVSIFKIFHLRPLRRLYVLESEAASAPGPEAAKPAPTPTLATPS